MTATPDGGPLLIGLTSDVEVTDGRVSVQAVQEELRPGGPLGIGRKSNGMSDSRRSAARQSCLRESSQSIISIIGTTDPWISWSSHPVRVTLP